MMGNMVMQVSSGGYSQRAGQALVRSPLGARSHWVAEHATRCALMKKVATIAVWTGTLFLLYRMQCSSFPFLAGGRRKGAAGFW